MEQNVIQKNMWNTAGKAGRVLGAVPVAYLLITQWMTMAEIPAFLQTIISMALWIIKFGGCIWFMIFFMKQFLSENPEADRNSVFKTGMAMAFLSALVYAAFTFANLAFLYPDYFAGQMETMMQQFAPLLDSNTTASMEKTMQNLPQITFFSNLIYCFIYGTALSSIISRYLTRLNPFNGYKSEDK